MAENYIQIRNVSTEPQYIFDVETKKRYDLPEKAILPFPERIAKIFLTGERAKYVQLYTPSSIPEIPGEPTVWIANMTGNPFAPDKRTNRQGELVANPNKKAATLTRSMHVAQQSDKDKDSYLIITNHPPIRIEVPPFKRISCPLSTALWLEGRDNQQEPEGTGKLIRCRPPTAFEPNETWDYDEVRIYASLVDDVAFDIVKAYPPLADETQAYEKKMDLLKKLFFKLVDDRVTLPTKEYFDAELAKIRASLTAQQKGNVSSAGARR